MFSEAGVLDPTILQKGIATIKEQMKDVQREALMIETEMEKRFSDMINKNTSQRYLPKSLTEEIIAHKNAANELKLRQAIGEAGDTAAPDAPLQTSNEPPKYVYAQIRDAIQDRLGGPFDYSQFAADLKEETSDLAAIQREFKFQAQMCQPPSFTERDFKKVPEFKFTLPDFDDGQPGQSIFVVDPIFGGQN